jgi:predicted outer membrane repeat protein
MDSTDSGPTITNCIFSGNSADCGGAIDSYGFLSPNVSNCTFSGNIAAVSGGGIYNDESSTIISNCIFWGDTPEEIYVSGGTPVVAYCDVQAGWTGEGNISHDPLFVDAAGDDYHLLSGSPAIDAGNPASDWSKEPWPNGSRVNMGAYGNTAEAMRSSADFEELGQLAGFWLVDHPFIDVAPGPGGDGIVNFLDFAVLAGYWSCEQ